MIDDIRVEAITLIQDIGKNDKLLKFFKQSNEILSVYHTMGQWCYLLRTSFEDKHRLEEWLKEVKRITVSDEFQFPVVTAIETLKIIDEYKETITLDRINVMECQHHAFIKVDYIGDDTLFVKDFKEHPAVPTILHVQGGTSFIMEIITNSVDTIRNIISSVKSHKNVFKVITQEVISVVKHV